MNTTGTSPFVIYFRKMEDEDRAGALQELVDALWAKDHDGFRTRIEAQMKAAMDAYVAETLFGFPPSGELEMRSSV